MLGQVRRMKALSLLSKKFIGVPCEAIWVTLPEQAMPRARIHADAGLGALVDPFIVQSIYLA